MVSREARVALLQRVLEVSFPSYRAKLACQQPKAPPQAGHEIARLGLEDMDAATNSAAAGSATVAEELPNISM